jgi:histone H3/H4
MADRVIVKSAVRDLVRDRFNVSEEFLDALNEDVVRLINRASSRARDNGRKTLKARDV